MVTDLAWPHVAGLRYWVANGATIVAHRAAREFLQSVVYRQWTLTPDLLAQKRKTARLKFVGFDAAYQLAGGATSLHPIDGIGSEVARWPICAGSPAVGVRLHTNRGTADPLHLRGVARRAARRITPRAHRSRTLADHALDEDRGTAKEG